MHTIQIIHTILHTRHTCIHYIHTYIHTLHTMHKDRPIFTCMHACMHACIACSHTYGGGPTQDIFYDVFYIRLILYKYYLRNQQEDIPVALTLVLYSSLSLYWASFNVNRVIWMYIRALWVWSYVRTLMYTYMLRIHTNTRIARVYSITSCYGVMVYVFYYRLHPSAFYSSHSY